VTAVVVAPNGLLLAYLKGRDVELYDLATGRTEGCLAGPVKYHTSLAFSLKSDWIAAGCEHEEIRIWDLSSHNVVARIPWKSPYPLPEVTSIAVSPEGRMIAWAASDGIHVWDRATAKELPVLPTEDKIWLQSLFWGVAFSPDGRVLVAAGGHATWKDQLFSETRIWDTGSWKALSAIASALNDPKKVKPKQPSQWWEGAVVPRPIFSPDGKMLTMNGAEKAIPVYELASGRERLVLQGHKESTAWVTLSRDGRTLASASWDNTIRLWDLENGIELRSLVGHRGKANSVAFTRDDKVLISAGDDSTILFWEVAAQTRRPVLSYQPASVKELDQWWADLEHSDAARAYRAITALVARPTQAVPWLAGQLKREQAVESGQINQLITDLDSKNYSERERASAELVKFGTAIASPLNAQLKQQPSAEPRRRIEVILSQLDINKSPNFLRKIRAIEALTRIATKQARQELVELAGGDPKAPITLEAADAVRTLDRIAAGR
jgi:hypothetical protein